MKNFTHLLSIAFISFFLIGIQPVHSAVWVVEASNYAFTPDELSVVQVGDTIRWVWIEGVHTTTSSSVPDGALEWDNLLDLDNPTFEYVVTVAGVYNYVCTPHVSLGMTGSFTVIGSSSAPELLAEPLLKASPNPFTTKVELSFSGEIPSPERLDVYDITGRKMRSIPLTSDHALTSIQVPLEELPAGNYFFRLIDVSGRVHTLKAAKY